MKPLSDKQRRYIESLRRHLGINETAMPSTSREGKNLITTLLQRRDARDRAELRRQAAAAPPSEELRVSIERVAARLGVEVDIPPTSADARFVLDDLYHRERQSRRVADGSLG